jgi:hypothetical protein
MTLRERNLRHKIERLQSLKSPTEAEKRELSEAQTALSFCLGSNPAPKTNQVRYRSTYTSQIDAAGDINNLLRANGNSAAAE